MKKMGGIWEGFPHPISPGLSRSVALLLHHHYHEDDDEEDDDGY